MKGVVVSRAHFLLLGIVFLFVACGGRKGHLRIRGEFENLPQADLLLYSPDGGMTTIDTLHIMKGRFDYSVRMEDNESYTFVVLYPNYRTLSFLAHEGQEVKIKGDALQLDNVRVEGADSVLPEEKHPGRQPVIVGKQLPKNNLIPRTPRHYLLIGFWSNWKNGAQQVNYNVRSALRDHPDSLHAFTYSLDVEPPRFHRTEETDSTIWKTYCDYRGWDNPLLDKLGIRNIPWLILLSPDGTVLAMGSKYHEDILPTLRKIGDKRL